MDIKDSYLHGTVGVVKSISVSADKLTYKLADINNTAKTITLPLATTTANGLMSKDDKLAINSLGNYVTLNTDQEITGTKTFTKQLKFTVALGTAPFLVTSDTKVNNLNADKLDNLDSSDFVRSYGVVGANYKKGNWLGYTYNTTEHGGVTAGGVLSFGLEGHGCQLNGYASKSNPLLYYRSYDSEGWSNWKQIAFTDSNITGNAATATHALTADKLKTKRKLWGLDFDGTADVSGNMLGVGDIQIIAGNNDKYITFASGINTPTNSWRIGYLGSLSGDNNYLTFLSTLTSADSWATAFYITNETLNAIFTGSVTAPTFKGNLDGTYVNKLTGYSKASSGSNVAATDTLNTALGKVEYKAHFAYEWITSVTASDTDQYVNKWGEIVGFLDSVKEGTDILDEFVTRQTDLTITGAKTFTKDPTINSLGSALKLYSSTNFCSIAFGITNSDGNQIRSFLVQRGDSDFVIANNEWTREYRVLHGGNSHINNGVITINGVSITPLTLHLSLANYLPLSGGTLTSANYNILNIKRDTDLNIGVSINFLNKNGDICDIMADPVTHSFKRGYNLQTYTIWDEGNDGPLMRFKGSVSTDYVDLTNTNAGDANYINLNPGIYGISRPGYSELLVSFASNTGSTSSLELKTSYEHNSKLYIRKTIDANRICGAWRALAFHDDISESINKYYWANLKLSETQDTNTSPIFGLTTAKYYVATLLISLKAYGLSNDLTVANRGGLFSNGVLFTNSGTPNDVGFIRLLGDTEENTVLEIGTGDDGAAANSEAIAARLYRSGAIAKEAWLLDTAGNTSFPGIVTSAGFVKAGSSDTHVLLGGGGHKAVSDFVLTSSLNNYVTLNTDLVVSGKKLFNNQLIIRKDVGVTGASVSDQQHNLLLQVMRYSDTHSVAIGVMPTGAGVIWAKANGIGYNTLYLNPHSKGVAIGCGDSRLPDLNDGYYFHIFGSTISNDNITANKFIKSGGKASQFLKADGSVDSNTYATTTSLGDYLPRAGGSMNKEAYISWGNTATNLYYDSVSDWSTIDGYGLRIISNIEDPATSQAPSHYCTALHVRGSYGFQLACAGGDVNQFYIASLSNKDASGKRIWNTILHSNNYTDYTVKKDGTGATGTWNISITGNAASASTSAKLSSSTAISAKSFSLSNASWTDTGYTFANLASGTYAVQITSGTNLVASGIMSVYKNLSDTAGDEIPLHVYGTAGWRPYLRTYANKLLISSNDASATSRTVTIKIALIL